MQEHAKQQHLSDAQFTDVLLGTNTADADQTRRHLETCSMCRAEHENARATLAGLRQWACQAAERPEGFWQRQAVAITARLAETAFLWRRWAWAGAMAVLVLAAALLTENAPPVPAVAPVDPDHALLVDVERSVRREVPQALEPATLLAQEVSRATEAKANP